MLQNQKENHSVLSIAQPALLQDTKQAVGSLTGERRVPQEVASLVLRGRILIDRFTYISSRGGIAYWVGRRMLSSQQRGMSRTSTAPVTVLVTATLVTILVSVSVTTLIVRIDVS